MALPVGGVQKSMVLSAQEVGELQPVASEVPSEHPLVENSLQTRLVFVCESEPRFQNSIPLSQSEKSFKSAQNLLFISLYG